MILPSFIILGAAKAGTTALYHYMNQHPQVGMSRVKETNYFALEGESLDFRGPGDRDYIGRFSVTTADGYQDQFREARGRRPSARPRRSTCTARRSRPAWPGSPPGPSSIAILRDPVDRAFSAFLHLVRDRRETTDDFAEALRLEDGRVADYWEHIWHYRRMGLYHEQIRRYLDHFDRDQVRVLIYDDFRADPAGVLAELFRFVGVDPTFEPDMTTRHNASDVPEGRRPPLRPEVRAGLQARFRDEILALQDLLGRDLSGWLGG